MLHWTWTHHKFFIIPGFVKLPKIKRLTEAGDLKLRVAEISTMEFEPWQASLETHSPMELLNFWWRYQPSCHKEKSLRDRAMLWGRISVVNSAVAFQGQEIWLELTGFVFLTGLLTYLFSYFDMHLGRGVLKDWTVTPTDLTHSPTNRYGSKGIIKMDMRRSGNMDIDFRLLKH
jgi:hypothetical protein